MKAPAATLVRVTVKVIVPAASLTDTSLTAMPGTAAPPPAGSAAGIDRARRRAAVTAQVAPGGPEVTRRSRCRAASPGSRARRRRCWSCPRPGRWRRSSRLRSSRIPRPWPTPLTSADQREAVVGAAFCRPSAGEVDDEACRSRAALIGDRAGQHRGLRRGGVDDGRARHGAVVADDRILPERSMPAAPAISMNSPVSAPALS